MEEQEPCPCCEGTCNPPAKVEITRFEGEPPPCEYEGDEALEREMKEFWSHTGANVDSLGTLTVGSRVHAEDIPALIEIAADPTEADWSEKPKPKPQPVTANMRRRASAGRRKAAEAKAGEKARQERLNGIKSRQTRRERRKGRLLAAKAQKRKSGRPTPRSVLGAF